MVAKRSSFNHFHDDIEMASLLETFVVVNNIWMVQLSESREGGGGGDCMEYDIGSGVE